jgi:hypothetical protein
MQPFEHLIEGGCCSRRVDEVDVKNNEFNWWLSRDTGRGVARS